MCHFLWFHDRKSITKVYLEVLVQSILHSQPEVLEIQGNFLSCMINKCPAKCLARVHVNIFTFFIRVT